MEALIIDSLSLLIRWLHLITGIAWIGASFYFVWLDNSLETPPQWKKDKGVSGDLWAFHGGGIYEVAKYSSSPEQMPKYLHWFKWEAYSTFITGALLLIVVYYLRADLYLMGSHPLIDTPIKSIIASLSFLIAGVVSYEMLIRSLAKNNPRIFLTGLIILIAFSCWLSTQWFSPRASYLHVGALMACVMVNNVFLGIIPAQKRFIQAIEGGKKTNSDEMAFAKRRSIHNNYFTLPVLFCMISNHYSFLYGHTYNWQILILIIAITAYARHFFNLRHRGLIKPHILIVAMGLALTLFAALAWEITLKNTSLNSNTLDRLEPKLTQKNQALGLVTTHCTVCHANTPTYAGFNAPPAGLVFENLEQLKHAKDIVLPAIKSNYMPLANLTQLTDEERQLMIEVLEAL